MAFEEDKQAAKDTLLAPTDKRVDMYRNCLIELKAALTNEQWNPNPYEIRPTVPAPGELDFLEEREAFRRAQFAAFLHILHTDDMGLWFKSPELLLTKIVAGMRRIPLIRRSFPASCIWRGRSCSMSVPTTKSGRPALRSTSNAAGRSTGASESIRP